MKLSGIVSHFNQWFDEATTRFKPVVFACLILAGLLSIYLLVEPYVRREVPAPSIVYQGDPGKRPNVFFILVDAMGAENMSMFGYDLPTTPKLEETTQDWTIYSNAHTAFSCTISALPTFLTGRYPVTNVYSQYGDLANQQAGWVNLAEVLKTDGYQTWWHGYTSPGFYHLGQGFDNTICNPDDPLYRALYKSRFLFREIKNKKFPYVSLAFRVNSLLTNEGLFDRCRSLDNLTPVISEVRAPSFYYYHYIGTHGVPYRSGPFLGSFLSTEAGMIDYRSQHQAYRAYEPSEQKIVDQLRLRYDEAILYQDTKLVELIDYLKREDLYDSSMIIITADHGQSFNGLYSSHCTPRLSYAETHVPLLIKYPYQTEGQRHDFVVSAVDLAPTILDALGYDYSPDLFDGVSLLDLAENPDPDRIVFSRRTLFNSDPLLRYAASESKYRFIIRNTKNYLFGYRTDPLEQKNLLYNHMTDQERLKRLQDALAMFADRARYIYNGGDILKAPPLP